MTNASERTGLLLLNLGSPKSPNVADVRIYLREFLMDPEVIDVPFVLRWILVNMIIVPTRAANSAELYRKIWRADHGSPLIYYSKSMASKLARELGRDFEVRLGMRYGEPSLQTAVQELMALPLKEIRVWPLYPQYAGSSSASVLNEARRLFAEAKFAGRVTYCDSFAADPGFIAAFTKNIVNEALRFQPDHILLSYHGLPIRHMKKISRACAGQGDCSLQTTAENQNCYRRQCYLTSKLIGEGLKRELGWSAEQLAVGFQSRLDNRWIRPFSDDFYRDLPKQGVKRLLVACPSFVADCLETLEEVAIRGRDDFRTHGGDDLKLVPCLNDSDDWVKAAADIARRSGLWTKAL